MGESKKNQGIPGSWFTLKLNEWMNENVGILQQVFIFTHIKILEKTLPNTNANTYLFISSLPI